MLGREAGGEMETGYTLVSKECWEGIGQNSPPHSSFGYCHFLIISIWFSSRFSGFFPLGLSIVNNPLVWMSLWILLRMCSSIHIYYLPRNMDCKAGIRPGCNTRSYHLHTDFWQIFYYVFNGRTICRWTGNELFTLRWNMMCRWTGNRIHMLLWLMIRNPHSVICA